MGVKVTHRPPNYALLLKGGIPDAMAKTAAYLQSSANRKINSGINPTNSSLTQKIKGGDKTLRDSNSMASGIAAHSTELTADASSNAPQAKILQRGGTIKPRKAKSLWIPAGPMTRTLERQYSATSPAKLIEAMKADGYSFFFTPLSKVYMAQKGKRGKPFALFIVRGSVTIPARPFLYIDGKDETYIVNLVRSALYKKLTGGTKI